MSTSLRTHSISKSVVAILILFLPFLSLLSCGDDEPTSRKKGGSLTATIAGENVATDQNSIYVYKGNLQLESSVNGNTIEFRLLSGVAKTTYGVGTSGVGKSGASLNYNNSFQGKTGEFVITEINEQTKTMSGTFYAVLANDSNEQLTISSGSFSNVPYEVQDEATGNTSIAMVDGVELKGVFSRASNIFFTEYTSTYKVVSITFPKTEVPITYNIADLDSYYNVKFIDGLYTYTATSGTITVSSVDVLNKKVEGTYSATVESSPVAGTTKQITGGAFSFTYP